VKKGTPKKRSEDMEEGEIMKETQLSIKNLHISYDGHEILKGINLDVHRGEVVVILGPSGCGKSTLLRCINGLESIQDGSIVLDREIMSGRSASELSGIRQKIGMVFQSYDLFPHKTILDNITLAPMKVQKRAKADVEQEALELLQRVNLRDKVHAYPRMLS
jgi:polar amino acid transport system ATP-binding protein